MVIRLRLADDTQHQLVRRDRGQPVHRRLPTRVVGQGDREDNGLPEPLPGRVQRTAPAVRRLIQYRPEPLVVRVGQRLTRQVLADAQVDEAQRLARALLSEYAGRHRELAELRGRFRPGHVELLAGQPLGARQGDRIGRVRRVGQVVQRCHWHTTFGG